MKKTILIFAFVFKLVSCSNLDTENDWVNIKDSNSIEKYQAYLINNPQTIHLTEIIDSLRIFWSQKNIFKDWHHNCFGNCLSLIINKNGELMFEGELIAKSELKEKVKYSILNPEHLPNLPESETITIENLGDFLVSLGVIDILTERDLDPNKYSEVIDLLTSCYLAMRSDLSKEIYRKNLDDLNELQLENIQKIIPIKIRFERYLPEPEELPTHPPKSYDRE